MDELDPNWEPETQPITHPFADDTPASLYKELKDGETLIRKAAHQVFEMEEHEARMHDKYEACKNDCLQRLFSEEEQPEVKKRTELQRQAIYRLKYRLERLAWQMAKRDSDAQKQYVTSLLGIQTSLEARAKLIGIDERFAGSRYGT